MSFAKVVSAGGGGGAAVVPVEALYRLHRPVDWIRSATLGEVHAAAALDLVQTPGRARAAQAAGGRRLRRARVAPRRRWSRSGSRPAMITPGCTGSPGSRRGPRPAGQGARSAGCGDEALLRAGPAPSGDGSGIADEPPTLPVTDLLARRGARAADVLGVERGRCRTHLLDRAHGVGRAARRPTMSSCLPRSATAGTSRPAPARRPAPRRSPPAACGCKPHGRRRWRRRAARRPGRRRCPRDGSRRSQAGLVEQVQVGLRRRQRTRSRAASPAAPGPRPGDPRRAARARVPAGSRRARTAPRQGAATARHAATSTAGSSVYCRDPIASTASTDPGASSTSSTGARTRVKPFPSRPESRAAACSAIRGEGSMPMTVYPLDRSRSAHRPTPQPSRQRPRAAAGSAAVQKVPGQVVVGPRCGNVDSAPHSVGARES